MTTTGTYSNVTSDAADQDESHDDVSVLAMSYLMYRIGKYMTFSKMFYLLFTRKRTEPIKPATVSLEESQRRKKIVSV